MKNFNLVQSGASEHFDSLAHHMGLKSKRITVTIPGEFVPLLEQRKREEHISTDSKFFVSMLMFDLTTRCPHTITGQVVNEPEIFF